VTADSYRKTSRTPVHRPWPKPSADAPCRRSYLCRAGLLRGHRMRSARAGGGDDSLIVCDHIGSWAILYTVRPGPSSAPPGLPPTSQTQRRQDRRRGEEERKREREKESSKNRPQRPSPSSTSSPSPLVHTARHAWGNCPAPAELPFLSSRPLALELVRFRQRQGNSAKLLLTRTNSRKPPKSPDCFTRQNLLQRHLESERNIPLPPSPAILTSNSPFHAHGPTHATRPP